MTDVSVVIPALNAVETLGEQLDAVLAQAGPPFEVVVVDNGSTDGTQQLVERYSRADKRVRLVDGRDVPLGGAAAKNLGVRSARSGWIAFCDADDVVRSGWLQGLCALLPTSAVVAAVCEYWSLNPMLPHQVQAERGTPSCYLGAPKFSGGAFAIHRQVYLDVGGFDELFAGAVDTEFALRVHRSGYTAVTAEDAEVAVRLPTTARQMFRRSRLLARSHPELRARYGGGVGKLAVRSFALGAVALLAKLPYLIDRGERLQRARFAGKLVGELQGRAALFRRQGLGNNTARSSNPPPTEHPEFGGGVEVLRDGG